LLPTRVFQVLHDIFWHLSMLRDVEWRTQHVDLRLNEIHLMNQEQEPLLGAQSTPKQHYAFPLFILTLIISIFCVHHVHSTLPSIPTDPHPTHFDTLNAHAHLQVLTRAPHGSNSHDNIRVRSYINAQVVDLQRLARNHSRQLEIYNDDGKMVVVRDDPTNPLASTDWVIDTTNIVFRLRGTNQLDRDAFLLSAHYDSVTTGYGANDAAIGVAALLEVARALVVGQPRDYDVMFNLNNGEEVGLLGSRVFVQHHEWNKHARAFLNVEGTGPGGRPLLFRATDPDTISVYAQSVPYPHANSLGIDAFKLKLLKSATDFSVYAPGMRGLDMAFYRDRFAYHTPRDTIDSVDPRSLYVLGANVLGFTHAMLDRNLTAIQDTSLAFVSYYDVLGLFMVVLGYGEFVAYHVLAVVLAVMVLVWHVARQAKRKRVSLTVAWIKTLVAWMWMSIYTLVAMFLLLVVMFQVWLVNPLLAYRDPYAVVITYALVVVWMLVLSNRYLRMGVHAEWYMAASLIYWMVGALFVTWLAWMWQVTSLYVVVWFLVSQTAGVLLVEMVYMYAWKGILTRTVVIAVQVAVPLVVLGDFAYGTIEGLRFAAADGSSSVVLLVIMAVFVLGGVMLVMPYVMAHLLTPWKPSARRNSVSQDDTKLSATYVLSVGALVFMVLFVLFRIPYSPETPLKFRFGQTVHVDNNTSTAVLQGVTDVHKLTAAMPQFTDKSVCRPEWDADAKLYACTFDNATRPVFSDGSDNPIRFISNPARHRAFFSVVDSMDCSLTFPHPVDLTLWTFDFVTLKDAADMEAQALVQVDNTTSVRYLQRAYNKVWVVQLDQAANATISCHYSEWDTVVAFKHLVHELPSWATITETNTKTLAHVQQSVSF
jgi:hypothetical protein